MIHNERPNLNVLSSRQPAHASADWPIALGIPRFSPQLADGSVVAQASVDTWRRLLRPVVAEGFDAIEIPTTWMPLPDMSTIRRREFFALLAELGLRVPGISVARRSIIQPGVEARNLDFHHRAIEVAAESGVAVVCMGLHEPLLYTQQQALWFWNSPGTAKPTDPEVYQTAVAGFRELGVHAADVGVTVSLEMYEDTFLGSADEAVHLISDVGLDNVGLNADIGNLLRLDRPVDTWEYMLHTTLPVTNYWHVKNYTRSLVGTEFFATAPVPLALGIIDYRAALGFALAHGFSGTLVVEHYGGDGISISAENRNYLRKLLSQ